jgi:hypothetical protein
VTFGSGGPGGSSGSVSLALDRRSSVGLARTLAESIAAGRTVGDAELRRFADSVLAAREVELALKLRDGDPRCNQRLADGLRLAICVLEQEHVTKAVQRGRRHG